MIAAIVERFLSAPLKRKVSDSSSICEAVLRVMLPKEMATRRVVFAETPAVSSKVRSVRLVDALDMLELL